MNRASARMLVTIGTSLMTLFAAAQTVDAQTLTFDDVSTSGVTGLNNNFSTYNGYTFFGFNVATSTSAGAGTNAVSPTKFALGQDILSSMYRTDAGFTFFSAWLSFRQFDIVNPINTSVGITVEGYRAGVVAPVFSQFIVLTNVAQQFQFNFLNIEEVTFDTQALTANGRNAALAMDNAQLAVVPEPSAMLLMTIGLAGLAVVALRYGPRRTREEGRVQ